MAEELKLIENHIKDLLFNKKDPAVPEAPKTAPNLNYSPNSFPFSSKSFLLTDDQEDKLLPSSLSLDCNLNEQSSSRLIDVNVLTDFAAKHVDVDSKMLTESPAFLPHPELENDLPISSTVKDSLLGFPASLENNSLSQFSFPEKAVGKDFRNREKGKSGASFEDSKDGERFDKKRKGRKNRKQAKDKVNQKIRGGVEMADSQTPSKDSPRRKNVKNSSPQKQVLSNEEKKGEPLPSKNESDSLYPKAVLPLEETEYVYSIVKDGFKFSCHICNYESKAKDYIIKHLNSDNHKELKKQIQADRVLPFLPSPLPCQWEVLQDLLTQIHTEHGLRAEDVALREMFFMRFKKFVEDNIPGCSVEMIGSSATGLGLKKSKVDMALKVEETQNIPDSLELVYKTLLSDPSFCDVQSDFKKKKVGVLFTDKETGLPCSLVLENQMSEKFARLFAFYSELDPRAKVLTSCFRHWAELCSLDNQDYGTLPSISFPIMLVYFLQQIEPPVLPVLNELKEYGNVDFAEKYVKGKVWKSENNSSIAELWLKLFHFYNFTYELGKHVICVRSSEKVMCADKNWSTKFYAIEDPFSRRNIAHVIPNYSVAHYIQQCFLRTYRYFAFPQLTSGEVKLIKDEEFENFLLSYSSSKAAARDESLEESALSDNEDSSIPDESSLLQDLEDHDPDLPIENVVLTLKKMLLDDNQDLSDEEVADDEDSQEGAKASVPLQKAESPKKETKKSKPEEKIVVRGSCKWDLGGIQVTKESLKYCFDPVIFKGGTKSVPYSCKLCKSSGHLKKNCPSEDRLPRPVLPEMTHDFLRIINKTLCYIKDKNCVDDGDKVFMMNNMREIETHIRKQFPDANLSMFGSFCNGFGFKSRSDMDFCLTFTDVADSKELDSADVIKKLAKHLQQYPKLENINPVTSAKVPIVKFACRESRMEGDISLYNTLAIANTEMLELYSKLDPRVQVLGFALKYFAKVLGICDASRGSLSSYAYILMVIFYLQQRQPAVIPVLQELHGAEKPTHMIDGWNVWYFKDVDKLPEVWPDYGKNTESPAELWLGLLSFYAFDFDWREHVVCIRQKALLTRFRKLWITDQIAIEDPFDLNHNLGAGLSRKMNMYIFKAFARGLERFGTPLPYDKIHTIIGHEVVYLFDRRYLNSGSEPPHDRGCRTCGKIGHIAKNCTQEKLCLFCRKSGHKAKDCPKKKQQKGKDRKQDRNNHENFPYENKSNVEQQNPLRHSNSDVQRTNNLPMNHLPKSNEENRKLLQMGYPAHRHPPPGFVKNFKGPPPGFQLMHNSNPKLSRFPHPEPFPRSKLIPPEMAQSPPKHFSSSPPKNFNMFHKESPPPMGFRTGLLPDPHMLPPGRMWPNSLPQRMPPPPYMDHRWKRGS